MRHAVIGHLLKDRRKNDGGSRRAQARRLGVPESTLRTAEESGSPRRGTVMVIYAALGLTGAK